MNVYYMPKSESCKLRPTTNKEGVNGKMENIYNNFSSVFLSIYVRTAKYKMSKKLFDLTADAALMICLPLLVTVGYFSLLFLIS